MIHDPLTCEHCQEQCTECGRYGRRVVVDESGVYMCLTLDSDPTYHGGRLVCDACYEAAKVRSEIGG